MINYTVGEVAKLLRLKTRTVREMIHDGRIKAFKYPRGKSWLIPEEEIERLARYNKSEQKDADED